MYQNDPSRFNAATKDMYNAHNGEKIKTRDGINGNKLKGRNIDKRSDAERMTRMIAFKKSKSRYQNNGREEVAD